jgi:predicted RecB family nuclease
VKTKVVTIQKEYGFYDEARQRKGIIDLLILEGNQATIVDYKTKAIDDPLYEQQLQAYASWLVDKGLIIKEKILISLTESKLKVIKP